MTKIKEAHGIMDALIGSSKERHQMVYVADGDGVVHLVAPDPATLTPAQARMFAGWLCAAADRVENEPPTKVEGAALVAGDIVRVRGEELRLIVDRLDDDGNVMCVRWDKISGPAHWYSPYALEKISTGID